MAILASIAKRLFGSSNDRVLKQFQQPVRTINELEASFDALSDDELRGKTDEFRQRVAAGESLDKLLPEAFAPCARQPSAPWASVTSMCN